MGKKKQKQQERRKAAEVLSPLPMPDKSFDGFLSVDVFVTLIDGREVYGFYNFDKRQWHITAGGNQIEIVQPDEVKSWREWGKEAETND